MKRILVTGGAGYIGSHTCKALARAGYLPVTFDNLSRGNRWAVRWGPLVVGDLLDRNALAHAFEKHSPAAVIHFAALAYVGESVVDPAPYYRTNVVGSLNLLEAMREHEVGHLVFSSTCATYGAPAQLPLTEAHPQQPVNPYGASKLMVENMLREFDRAYGLRSTSLRYFNAAGADAEGEIGEAHDPETHLIPLALDVAAGARHELAIFGDRHSTPDGTCVRDYVHVDDLAQAHVLALAALESGGRGGAYNVGTGRGHSVREVVESARKVTGHPLPVAVHAAREGDPPSLVADGSRIASELGWEPRHRDLDAIIDSAWRWRKGTVPPAIA